MNNECTCTVSYGPCFIHFNSWSEARGPRIEKLRTRCSNLWYGLRKCRLVRCLISWKLNIAGRHNMKSRGLFSRILTAKSTNHSVVLPEKYN